MVFSIVLSIADAITREQAIFQIYQILGLILLINVVLHPICLILVNAWRNSTAGNAVITVKLPKCLELLEMCTCWSSGKWWIEPRIARQIERQLFELRDFVISGDVDLGHAANQYQYLRITKYARTGVSHTFARKKAAKRLQVGTRDNVDNFPAKPVQRTVSHWDILWHIIRVFHVVSCTPLEYAHALAPIVGSQVDMNLIWERVLLPNCDRRNVIKIAIHNSDNFCCGFL